MWRLKGGAWYANIKLINKATNNSGANVKQNAMPTAPKQEPNSLLLNTGPTYFMLFRQFIKVPHTVA